MFSDKVTVELLVVMAIGDTLYFSRSFIKVGHLFLFSCQAISFVSLVFICKNKSTLGSA